jgi:hypothetical protein
LINDFLFYPFSGFDNVCLQPDLSENPFFGAGKSAEKKRLGAEGGNCCPNFKNF